MIPYRASPVEPWPGWVTSRAAQAVYGEHLVRIGRLIPALLLGHVVDRRDVSAAHERGDRERVLAEASLQAMECRDNLLETAVVLDVLALCRRPGGPDEADELSTDASVVAGHLAEYDLLHDTSLTGRIPAPLGVGSTEAERDSVRGYARREWRARESSRSS